MSAGGMGCVRAQQVHAAEAVVGRERCGGGGGGYFQMPLHYPRYTKSDYETMPEWKLDCLLAQYGLPLVGDVPEKRKFAIGAFLWN
ncbi:hypothetical protein ACLOJK_014471 [Asimina triloba]